jgi:hypothetical protein
MLGLIDGLRLGDTETSTKVRIWICSYLAQSTGMMAVKSTVASGVVAGVNA